MTTAKEILEAAGLQDTFWGRRIIASERLGEAVDESAELADEWQTCACGQQDPRIPRAYRFGPPIDKAMYADGTSFGFCWRNNPAGDEYFDMPKAALLLVAIEARAKEVLAVQP